MDVRAAVAVKAGQPLEITTSVVTFQDRRAASKSTTEKRLS
jgi:hypothetical protein